VDSTSQLQVTLGLRADYMQSEGQVCLEFLRSHVPIPGKEIPLVKGLLL
jgi:hypothetical protein